MATRGSSAQRRQEIVEGLLCEMAASGYAGASVQSIARAAGLTPGLVHYHFGSKQDILLALVETLSARLGVRLAALDQQAQTPWARVEAWIDAHLRLGAGADPRAVACWVQIGAEALHQPAVGTAYAAALSADAAGLRERLLAAGVAATSADAAAAGLLAAVQGAYQLSLAVPTLIPSGTAAETVRRMAAGLRT